MFLKLRRLEFISYWSGLVKIKAHAAAASSPAILSIQCLTRADASILSLSPSVLNVSNLYQVYICTKCPGYRYREPFYISVPRVHMSIRWLAPILSRICGVGRCSFCHVCLPEQSLCEVWLSPHCLLLCLRLPAWFLPFHPSLPACRLAAGESAAANKAW